MSGCGTLSNRLDFGGGASIAGSKKPQALPDELDPMFEALLEALEQALDLASSDDREDGGVAAWRRGGVGAWRLQAAAEGGLERDTRRILLSKTKAKSPGPMLTPGVRLTRELRGRVCDVEVVGEGFLYEGSACASLSEVAREITGVRWNGPRFLGLRKEAA